MGFNLAVTSLEIIAPQGGAYVFPTAGQHMHIKSSSAEDKGTATAGTGARTVTLYYLDSGYREKSETVTLNGDTAVETSATDIFRVQNIRVATAGTSNTAVGNISLTNHDENVTYGYIAATYTRQRQMVWTVPLGKKLYVAMANVYAMHTVANKRCLITLRATYDDKSKTIPSAGLLFFAYAEAIIGEAPIHSEYPVYKTFPEKTDIKVEGVSDGTASVSIVLSGYTRKM